MASTKNYEFLSCEPTKKLSEGEELVHESVKVPRIWIDYDYEINENYCKLLSLMNGKDGWWSKYAKYVNFLKSDETHYLGIVSAVAYPKATSSQLEAITISFVWAISFDDEVLEIANDPESLVEYKQKFLQFFDSKDLDVAKEFSIYCNLILQVYLKLEFYMNENHKNRFRTILEEYLEGAIEEVRIVNKNRSETNLDEFLEVRCKTSSFNLYELYGEICDGIETSKYSNDIMMIKNQQAITRMVSYLNDIYSYNKELASGFKGNLIYQLQKHFNCSSKRSMELATEIFKKEKQDFDLTAVALIEKYSNDEIKKYVKSMRNWAIANILIYKYYYRYTIENNKAALLETG